MRALRELLLEILQTAFRLFPWPVEPGLRQVGEPGPASPVIVTCDYGLTVRRVLRALRGVDAWVVVAPSQGINVWCAAAGGHFGSHQIVTALKTSGVEERVEHRRAILPQLAAAGVLAREVSRRTGWRVRFGPVDARDLPRYLASGQQKDPRMRVVGFGLGERLEMAVAWAAPTSLLAGLPAALLRPRWGLALAVLFWALALAVFLVYDRFPEPRRPLFTAAAAAVAAAVAALGGGGAWPTLAAAAAAAVASAVLTFDYQGSTPIEGPSRFDEADFRITLDAERCVGVYSCLEVCPEAVFEKAAAERRIDLAHPERCIRCGACVVQCPTDALFFENRAGRRVEPDVIRRFKLNLLGRRTVDAGGGDRSR